MFVPGYKPFFFSKMNLAILTWGVYGIDCLLKPASYIQNKFCIKHETDLFRNMLEDSRGSVRSIIKRKLKMSEERVNKLYHLLLAWHLTALGLVLLTVLSRMAQSCLPKWTWHAAYWKPAGHLAKELEMEELFSLWPKERQAQACSSPHCNPTRKIQKVKKWKIFFI